MSRSVTTMPVGQLARRLAAREQPAGRDSRGGEGEPWDKLAAFLCCADSEEFDLSDAAVALDADEHVVWACLAVRSPGRTSLLILGPLPNRRPHDAALSDAVGLLVQQERRHGIRLVQALLPPAEHAEGQLLLNCGFVRLAELIYMQADLPSSPREPTGSKDRWPARRGDSVVTWNDAEASEFAGAIEASYVKTLDCPGLEGARQIEDILAGHRASGIFRPDLWFLYRQGGRPIGVVLLNEIVSPAKDSVELVYMGVLATVRGQGLGRRMLSHAMGAARQAGYRRMLLAVDSNNPPALKLYRRRAFRETMRRVAYVLPRSDTVPEAVGRASSESR